MAKQQPAVGEQEAVSETQARGGSDPPVEGISQRTSSVNPDSAVDTQPHPDLDAHGGSEQGGMAGSVAPLGGETTKSAADGNANGQGGVASGAPG